MLWTKKPVAKTLGSLQDQVDTLNSKIGNVGSTDLQAQITSLNSNINSLLVQTAQFSISPNSYTDIDYPTGFDQLNTRILSAVVAYYYVDFTNLTVQLTETKIRVFNASAQNWAGVQLVLAKFARTDI